MWDFIKVISVLFIFTYSPVVSHLTLTVTLSAMDTMRNWSLMSFCFFYSRSETLTIDIPVTPVQTHTSAALRSHLFPFSTPVFCMRFASQWGRREWHNGIPVSKSSSSSFTVSVPLHCHLFWLSHASRVSSKMKRWWLDLICDYKKFKRILHFLIVFTWLILSSKLKLSISCCCHYFSFKHSTSRLFCFQLSLAGL